MSLSQWTSLEDTFPQIEQTNNASEEMLPKWKNPSNVTPNPSRSESVTTAITLGTLPLNACTLDKHKDTRPMSRTTWTRMKT